MPYRIERRATCPPDKPFAVVLEASGETVACHATRAGAERQIAAIYASEADIEKQQPSSSQVHVDTITGGSRKRRKPHYEPAVVIKGDFQGHPFRGNQWTDSSGVSRSGASAGRRSKKPVARSLEDKLVDGPAHLRLGRDAEGMPVVGSTEELRARYGTTAAEIRNYFDALGITLVIDQPTTANTDATYGALQAVEDMHANLNLDWDNFRMVITASGSALMGGETSAHGSFHIVGAGGKVHIALDNVSGYIERFAGEGHLGEQGHTFNTEAQTVFNPWTSSQIIAAAATRGSTTERASTLAEAKRRLAYAVMVHEFGHVLDKQMGYDDPVDPRYTQPYATSRMFDTTASERKAKEGVIRTLRYWSDIHGARGYSTKEDTYDGEFVATRTLTGYAMQNMNERFAESFATWWLLGQSEITIVGRPNGDLKAKQQVPLMMAPILRDAGDLVKQATVIEDDITRWSADDPVFIFAFAPMARVAGVAKGDYVGHPFRGNQWTDASGISRGSQGSAVSGGVAQLEPVDSIEEARRTGRPLSVLHRDHYPPAVKAALAANAQAGAAMTALHAKHGGDMQAITADPDYGVVQLALAVTALQARLGLQQAYAESLGFVVIQPDADGQYPREQEYPFEYVDRDSDGRLRRTELVMSDSNIGGEDAVLRLSSGIIPTPLVLTNPDGTNTVLWGDNIEAMWPQDARAERFTNIDRVPFSEVLGRISRYHREEGQDGALAGSRGGVAVREALVAECRRLGIDLPQFTPPVRMSGSALVAAGMDRDEIGAAIHHVEEVGRAFMMHKPLLTKDSWENRGQEGSRSDNLAMQAQHVTADAPISVTVPQSAVGSIVKDGRLKTQFETGKSGGKNVPALREVWEATMFGYVRGMPPEARPVYGMVETGGAKPSSARGNDQYGTVTLVLKDSIKDRTTITQDDSLFINAEHVPVREASTRLAQAPRERPPRAYYEAQIHGGVTTADIERVIIDTSVYKNFEWTTAQPSASLLKTLDKAGIPYEIRDGRAEKAASETTKAAVAPTVLIKGDFVGHPFRGNQWVDSSGAARGVTSTRASGHPAERLLHGVREYRVHPVEYTPDRWAPTLFIDGKPTTIQGGVAHMTRAKAEKELVKFQKQTEQFLSTLTDVKEVEGRDGPLTEAAATVNGRRATYRIGWAEEGRVEALEEYSRSSIELNRRLRSGELVDGPLDEYMTSGSTMAVFRSISNDRGTAERIASELEGGATIIDRGYASTSRKLVEAQQMDAVGDGIILRIVIPSGAPRIQVPEGVGFDQDEVILPRNTALRPTGKVSTDDEGRRVFDVEMVEDADVEKAVMSMVKGDYVGHPFRGNQWMDASGVSRGGAGSSLDQDRQAYEMRAAGQSWEQIARTLGYANGGSVRRLAMRHEARLKAEGGAVEVKPQPEAEKPPVGPQTGFVGGLRPATSDPDAAAREGRPLQGWVQFSPEIQARLDERDKSIVRFHALEVEARDIIDRYLETATEEQKKDMRARSYVDVLERAAKVDPEFASRLAKVRAQAGTNEDRSESISALVEDMSQELMLASGMRLRTPAEIAQLQADLKITDNWEAPREQREAARARLAASNVRLEWYDESREGKGGRMRADARMETVHFSFYDEEHNPDAFGKQFLAKFDIGPLRAQGYSDQQIGDIIRTSRRVAADRTYTPTWFAVQREADPRDPLASVRERQLEAIAAVEEDVKDAPVSITVPSRVLAQVLNEGRYKTQFETRRSGGLNDPQARQEEEADRFGYPPHMAPEHRPVYGMVEAGGVAAPSTRNNLQYGNAVMVLKPEVRERTTFTIGDSLSLHTPSAPLTNPRAVPAVTGVDASLRTSAEWRAQPQKYYEAQIHGGVRTSDIAYVVFEVGADVVGTGVRDEGQVIGKTKPPTASVLKSLDKAGVPYVIVQAGEPVTPPVGKSRGIYFGPTILLKGDYVGHPFRGNQWTDASGVGVGAASSSLGRGGQMRAASIADIINEKTSNLAMNGVTVTFHAAGVPRNLRERYAGELNDVESDKTDVLNGLTAAEEAINSADAVHTLTLRNGVLAGALDMSRQPRESRAGFKVLMMHNLGSTFLVDGAGSTLFGAAVRQAAELGVGLQLVPLNLKAQRFWEAMGFQDYLIGKGPFMSEFMVASPELVAEIASHLDPLEADDS